jgi:hypothetical protein
MIKSTQIKIDGINGSRVDLIKAEIAKYLTDCLSPIEQPKVSVVSVKINMSK